MYSPYKILTQSGFITPPKQDCWCDVPYSPYYVIRTSANGSAVCWSCDFRLYHMTSKLRSHCDVIQAELALPDSQRYP